MAPKKKQTRKSGAISEHDRRNLELMFQSYFHMVMIFANVAFVAMIVGAVASFQVSKTISDIVFLSGIGFAFIMLIPIGYLLRKTGRIEEKLGVKKTAEKYDV